MTEMPVFMTLLLLVFFLDHVQMKHKIRAGWVRVLHVLDRG